MECLNWRGRLIASVNAPSLEPGLGAAQATVEVNRKRPVYFGNEKVETPIYYGEELPPGAVVEGPAIIEETTSTLVVNPGATARVSAGGRYILSPPAESQL